MFTVYAIYNHTCGKIYVGQTKDVVERLALHNEHTFGGYTSRFPGVWVLIHQESFETRQEALSREKQLKSFRGREFIRNNIPR